MLTEKVSELAAALKSTQDELRSTKNQLHRLESDHVTVMNKELESKSDQSKVAFSVGLTGSEGPYTGVKILVFRNIFYNLGQAYNPATGFFTAPTKGVYFFTFTGFNKHHVQSGVMMYHNSSMLRFPRIPGSSGASFTSSFARAMEVGDVVYIQLPAEYTLYEHGHRCTLTGFLLYPL